ncbi:MAG: galactose mutarotase [Vallitaleaceae bacterium]|nr:galactose mutarotase [Vallitaleaceae bacterium]
MKISSKLFGQTNDGKEIYSYTLENDLKHTITIITYGGIITKINVPNREGIIENVVLGFNDISSYETLSPFFGAITGPFAGRISGASFDIDGVNYELEKNDGPNSLHGGSKAFDKVVWEASTLEYADKVSLVLNYLSPDGEFGYPGNVDIIVTYTWDQTDTLSIDYKATTDKSTFLNLTNHSYFNLSGDTSTTILDHELMIASKNFIGITDKAIPMSIIEAENTPFDFTTAKKVGADIEVDYEQLKNGSGYDHPFILEEQRDNSDIVASLYDSKSGRLMTVQTTEKMLVFYAGGHLTDDMHVYNNQPIKQRTALCLETQNAPDHMHFDAVSSYILEPNDLYRSHTAFRFSCK